MVAQRRKTLRSLLLILCVCLASLATPPLSNASAEIPRLVIATPTPFDTLDPHVAFDTRRSDLRFQLYEGLFRWQDSPLRVSPWLAQSYTISEDGRTLRFALRKDARFHDGREVRASDVVYSVERILALKRGLAPLLASLVAPGATKVIDSHTVEFSLNRASPLFLTLIPEIAIVNAELLKANELNNDWGRGWLQSNDAGSGSYTFKMRSTSGGVVVARFAGHWSPEWPAKPIEEIEWRTVVDPEARVAGLVAGDLHIVEGEYLPHQLKKLRELKDVAVLESEAPRIFLGLLHSGREPMKAAAFRKVVARIFDADHFIESTIGKGATPIAIPLPPALGTPPPGLVSPTFDFAGAADALSKLKVAPRDLTIGAIAGDPHSERAATILLDGLLKLGLTARVVVEPWPVVAGRMRDEKQMYDVLFLWRGARYLDANNWLGEMFDCDLMGAGNASWYCNRDADRLLKEARGLTDARARRQTFEKAAAILAEDQAALFVAAGKRQVGISRRLKGLRIVPVGDAIDARMTTID